MFFCIYVYMFISYESMNFCILTSMCFGSSAVHRKETNGTSLKNFNQLCHVSCQKCQLDQEYARQDSFLPNLPWHGTDYNMINRFSATDISGFWTWPFFPCWPWGWRIPIIQIGVFVLVWVIGLMVFHVFVYVCLMVFCCVCVYILSSISNRVKKKNIGILMLQVQRISLLVSSLFLKLGLLRATKVVPYRYEPLR